MFFPPSRRWKTTAPSTVPRRSTRRGGRLPGEACVPASREDGLLRGLMPVPLNGGLRPGMPPVRVAVGDLPERLWIKNTSRNPKALDLLPPVTVNSRLERPGDVD